MAGKWLGALPARMLCEKAGAKDPPNRSGRPAVLTDGASLVTHPSFFLSRSFAARRGGNTGA